METAETTPPAASSFLALWQADGAACRLGDCCCYYYDEDGKKVDPDESKWASVRYWQLRGDQFMEVPAPEMWCETRWAIPVGVRHGPRPTGLITPRVGRSVSAAGRKWRAGERIGSSHGPPAAVAARAF